MRAENGSCSPLPAHPAWLNATEGCRASFPYCAVDRGKDAEIRVRLPTVSRKHCLLRLRKNKVGMQWQLGMSVCTVV